jgi:hypothetical protein
MKISFPCVVSFASVQARLEYFNKADFKKLKILKGVEHCLLGIYFIITPSAYIPFNRKDGLISLAIITK